MNLTSLSDADLIKLASALVDADTEKASDIIAEIDAEREARKDSGHSAKTGYQIELLVDGKWKPIDKTHMSIAVYSQFYASKDDAQKAVDRINSKIKNRVFEYQTKQIKKSEYRFVQVTTIREIA